MPEKALSEHEHRLLDHSTISGLKEASLTPPRRGLLTPEMLARLEALEASMRALSGAEAGDYPTTTEMRQAIQAAVVAATGGTGSYLTEGTHDVLDHTGLTGVGVSDHGALTGLSDDDHTNLLNETRHDALDHTGLTGCGGNPEIWLPAIEGWPANTSGCGALSRVEMSTNKQYLPYFAFGAAGTTYAQWLALLPDDYDGGTVTVKFYWSVDYAGVNPGVVWAADAVAWNNNEALDAAFGTAQQVTDNPAATASYLMISGATPALTIANTPAAGHMAMIRAARLPGDAADTYGGDIRLHGLRIAYTQG